MPKSRGGDNCIVITADKLSKRDNIFIEDAVDGILSVALNAPSCEVYNVSSNGELDNFAGIDRQAETLMELTNGKVLYKNPNLIHINGDILDNTKLKKLGWSLQTSLKNGLTKTLNYYLQS